MQWSPHRPKGREAIGVATSSPLVEFYDLKLSPDGKSAELVSSAWLGPFDDLSGEEKTGDILALSLAWHPRRSKLMAVTLSDGEVQFCETEGDFAEINHNMSTSAPEPLKHELEAWTAAWSPSSVGTFSGGDDCVLRYMRPNAARDGIEASWADRKLHNAGVTAILPLSDELVVTGSYDDHVRLIYAPLVGRRRVLAERNLGGGVWRLKMIESDELPASDTARYDCPLSLTPELSIPGENFTIVIRQNAMTQADIPSQQLIAALHLHHPRQLHARRRSRAAALQARYRRVAVRSRGRIHGAPEHELRE